MSIPRKSILGEPVVDAELEELLNLLGPDPLTELEISEQKASFVFGNAPRNSETTRESAQRSVAHTLM